MDRFECLEVLGEHSHLIPRFGEICGLSMAVDQAAMKTTFNDGVSYGAIAVKRKY